MHPASTVLAVAVVLVCAALAWACYRGDPGWGSIDYPPEPPIVERTADAGRG